MTITRRRFQEVGNTDADEPQGTKTANPPTADMTEVVAWVPRPLHLTLDDGSPVHYPNGNTKMPRAHAEHWFAKASGVTIPADALGVKNG